MNSYRVGRFKFLRRHLSHIAIVTVNRSARRLPNHCTYNISQERLQWPNESFSVVIAHTFDAYSSCLPLLPLVTGVTSSVCLSALYVCPSTSSPAYPYINMYVYQFDRCMSVCRGVFLCVYIIGHLLLWWSQRCWWALDEVRLLHYRQFSGRSRQPTLWQAYLHPKR